MNENLFPLIYKPGIKKDGTLFQSEYCTNGFWVRFQNGMVKKIGGMKSTPYVTAVARSTALMILPRNTDNDLFGYIGGAGTLRTYTTGKDFQGGALGAAITPVYGDETTWQLEKVVDKANDTSFIAAFVMNNRTNIFDDTAATLHKITPFQAGAAPNPVAHITQKANGGICYAEPFLFVYGNNGYVQYSASNNPFQFNEGAAAVVDVTPAKHFTIPPGDKIIYARQIRGGQNNPTLLFWTLSALVVVRNVGEEAPLFQPEKIAEASILSSRCVVENSGVFYWPGTDDFYVYNGISQRMQNNVNLRYFFDRIDMNKRQLVFGVKNERKEIWWWYPEKINAGNPAIGCTAALVYNISENTWFDTAVARDSAYFCRELGFMISLGKPLVGGSQNNYIWRHEVGISQRRWDPALNNNHGALERLDITSSFTTPTFSWAAFNPLKQPTGVNKWMMINRIEPDFISEQNIVYNMRLFVNTKEYAQSPNVQRGPYTFTNTTEKIDLYVQGRHLSLTFSSTEDFEMGQVMMLLSVGDER